MRYLLSIIAVLLIITWLIGFAGYNTGGTIHILLVFAVILLIIKFFRKEIFFKRFSN